MLSALRERPGQFGAFFVQLARECRFDLLDLKPHVIAVIPKGTTNEFWKAVNAGAFKAGDELRAKGVAVVRGRRLSR